MKYFISVFLILIGLSANCQQTITVCGEAYPVTGVSKTYVSVLSTQKDPVGDKFIHLAVIPVKLDNTFSEKIPLNAPKMLVIRFGGNRMTVVYALPGDSIHIHFEQVNKPDTVKNMMMTRVFKWTEKETFTGTDPGRLGFFRLLEDRTGTLDGPPFKMNTDSAGFLEAYKARVSTLYKQRLKILDDEATSHHFTSELKNIAANEIWGEYLCDMMYLGFYIDKFEGKYPPGYFAEVDADVMTWDRLKNSRSNASACYTNVMYYNRRIPKQTPEAKLAAVFNNIMKFKDDSVRNYMLALILSRNMETAPANFDELLERFEDVCTNKEYVSGVLGLYKPAIVGKTLPENVLNAHLKTPNGVFTTLKDIMPKDKPVFIDFWASWCGPCKQEIPIISKLAAKYSDKMDFRFISVDKMEKEADWLKAIRAANFKGAQYLIQDAALTDFAQVKTIPRYLIIDKDGRLSTFRGPNLLADADGFEKTIKAVLGN